ncbi:MAG: hypothetical protein ACI92G_003787 [Candidatus Pelagisphaera sp.]|jgi:hypothetical protein
MRIATLLTTCLDTTRSYSFGSNTPIECKAGPFSLVPLLVNACFSSIGITNAFGAVNALLLSNNLSVQTTSNAMKMINTKSIVTLTALLVTLAIGCSDKQKGDQVKVEEKAEKVISKAKATSKEVADMTKDAWNSLSEYTFDKKDQAATFIDKQIASLDDEIEDLKKSASKSSNAKEKTAQAIDALEEKRRDFALQTKKMTNATSETWDDVKNETQEKWNDFTTFLQKTKNDLSSS